MGFRISDGQYLAIHQRGRAVTKRRPMLGNSNEWGKELLYEIV
jgi:hypothetical protein